MIVNFYFHSLLIIKITKTKAEHEILQIRSIEKRNIKYDDESVLQISVQWMHRKQIIEH